MIKEIRIRNFAIIENLAVNFEKGLNVLTGETGAGKSIIIDALNLLLGGRADTDSIRSGETTAFVEAVFEDDGVKFGKLPSTPNNTEQLLGLYTHIAELMAKSMSFGDPVIDEVEGEKAKKDAAGSPKSSKKKSRSTSR